MDRPLIELHGVTKRFGERPAVQDLAFEVAPGEIVGLLGPNGSGKTTTIRLINGVIRPDAGAITVAGHDPIRQGDAIRRMSGILTESAGLYLSMSGLENLRFFARLYGMSEVRRPEELLEEFGLGPHGHQKVGTYSTGMKKRLGLAKALLHRPRLLFLDEPTNGLDPEGIRMVLEYIAQLNRRDGTTIILCSHLLQQLEVICHRYVFIDKGRVIERGTLQELEDKYRAEVVLEVETDLRLEEGAYGGYPARQLGRDRVRFTLPSRAAIPRLLRHLVQEAAVYGATTVDRNLESLYFKIYEEDGP